MYVKKKTNGHPNEEANKNYFSSCQNSQGIITAVANSFQRYLSFLQDYGCLSPTEICGQSLNGAIFEDSNMLESKK